MATIPFDITGMLPAALTAPDMTEAAFLDLCGQFPEATLEYTPEGTVLIMPPTDPKTGMCVTAVVTQLDNWSQRSGSGYVIGPDAGFFLPGGSRRSPDASWFNAARWNAAQKPGTRFPEFAPEFVVEVRSPDDRIVVLREKMQEYIDSGVQLAWLIEPRERRVTIYRPGREPEILDNPVSVTGEGPITGFTLVLDRVFAA